MEKEIETWWGVVEMFRGAGIVAKSVRRDVVKGV
jgi:hypothetical protein